MRISDWSSDVCSSDLRAVFGTQAKWVTEIDQVDRIPEIISRAFHVATSGRPGPVVIALPEDMLVEYAEVADAPHYEVLESAATAQQMDALAAQLANARKPDRKSGVEGKSVSVRVDLGGGRIIKKK